MSAGPRKTKKKIPLPLKRLRKAMPPPARVLRDKKKYDRKRGRNEAKRAIRESASSPAARPAE